MVKARLPANEHGEDMDRISAMPDQMLIHILSFLAMKQVITAASVSKRWRFLWLSASSLIFHFVGTTHLQACYFIDFMATTLMFHTAPKIKKFSVTANDQWTCRSNAHTTVNSWIRFATLKSVEELHIHLSGTPYSLPHQLYKNDHIRVMSFKGCNLKNLPNKRVSWGSLEILSISGCDRITKQMIWKILDGCPKIVCFDVTDSFDDRGRIVDHHYRYFRDKC